MYQEWLEYELLNNWNSYSGPVLRANPAEGAATAVHLSTREVYAPKETKLSQVLTSWYQMAIKVLSETGVLTWRLPKAAQQAEKAQQLVVQVSGSSPG